MSLLSRSSLAILFLSVTGCSGHLPVSAGSLSQLPDRYSAQVARAEFSGVAIETGQQDAGKSALAEPRGDWWRQYGSEELDALVDRAIGNNLDIKIASARLLQSEAQAQATSAGGMPTLAMQMASGAQAADGSLGSVPTRGGASSQGSHQLSLRGAWRLDIWGEQGARNESARQQLERAVHYRNDVVKNVIAAVVARFLEYRSLNDRIRIAIEVEEAIGETIPVVQKRLLAGDATLTELEQQRAAAYAMQAAIPGLQQQRDETLAALATLLASPADGLMLTDQGLGTLTVPEAAVGLPSSLLTRRPDIRMVEARMLAADADLLAARARIFPTIDLSGQAGYSGRYFDQLFSPGALFWNVIGGLTATIFDGGRRSKESDYSAAVQVELVETYAKTIYLALEEVERSLISLRWGDKRIRAQESAAESAKRAWEASRKIYLHGGLDHLALLDAERNYYRYLDDYHRSKLDQLRSHANLFQALGLGGATSSVESAKSPLVAAVHQVNGAVQAGTDWLFPFAEPKSEGENAPPALSPGERRDRWAVDLAGVYIEDTVTILWRDLGRRYPELKAEGKQMLLTRLGSTEGLATPLTWYRPSIGTYGSQKLADEFCRKLQAGFVRCAVSRTGFP